MAHVYKYGRLTPDSVTHPWLMGYMSVSHFACHVSCHGNCLMMIDIELKVEVMEVDKAIHVLEACKTQHVSNDYCYLYSHQFSN